MTHEDDLKLARNIAATVLEGESEWSRLIANDVRAGGCDDGSAVQSALAAIRAERARVVEWLLAQSGEKPTTFQQRNLAYQIAARAFADAIAAGQHVGGER